MATDTRFPYRIYGSQQDNSTLAIGTRSERGPISRLNWYDVGGGESGFIAVRPDDPDIVYSSDLPGLGVTRYDHKNLQIREIAPWAESVTEKLETSRFRFNWSTPVVLSPHDPDILYVCGNHVFRTRNEGESWEVISPDLTRNDKSKLGIAGGPISFTHRATDHYCTITSLSESPLQAGVIWVGTDDGLVHVSRDHGANWQNVTPADLPEWSEVQVEASRHCNETAFITATAHKLDDFQPYLFMTDDAGQAWQRIDSALPRDEFLRVVREDLTRPGLLYAGTEAGFYLSLDYGGRWLPLRNNLPHVSVYDIALKERDIVIGTFGRGMWILDDIAPLQQWNDSLASAAIHLFQPTNVYRLTRQIIRRDSLLELYEPFAARNPPAGITVDYWLKTAPDQPLALELLDADGATIRRYVSGDEFAPESEQPEPGLRWGNITFVDDPPLKSLSAKPGLHRVEIPLSHPPAFKLPGMLTMGVTSPIMAPGRYTIRLRCGEKQWTQPVHVHGDPRVATTPSEYQRQFDLMIAVRDSVSLIHRTVADMRSIVGQLDALIAEARQDVGESTIQDAARSLRQRLRDIENSLIQPMLTDGLVPKWTRCIFRPSWITNWRNSVTK